MLHQVETRVEDPIITDSTAMTRVVKRFSAQAYCVLVLTCRGKALQVVQRVPRGFGFEAWRQLYEEFEPHLPVKSQGMRQALLSSTKSDESVQMVRQQGNWQKVCEEQLGDKVSDLQPGRPMDWDLLSQEVTECLRASRMCETFGSSDPTDLASFGEEEDDKSVKLKKYVGWWVAGHNENECRDFSSGPEKKCDQHRAAQCAGVKEDPEARPKKLSGERGTGVLSSAAEQNACHLHEDDSDQRQYSCPLPTEGGVNDLENLAESSSLQVWFGMEALGAHVCDRLDAIATTEQHSKTAFRSDVQVEPSEEVPVNSESVTGVGSFRMLRASSP